MMEGWVREVAIHCKQKKIVKIFTSFGCCMRRIFIRKLLLCACCLWAGERVRSNMILNCYFFGIKHETQHTLHCLTFVTAETSKELLLRVKWFFMHFVVVCVRVCSLLVFFGLALGEFVVDDVVQIFFYIIKYCGVKKCTETVTY